MWGTLVYELLMGSRPGTWMRKRFLTDVIGYLENKRWEVEGEDLLKALDIVALLPIGEV